MSLSVPEWLDLMSQRFSSDFADFEVYVFEGTQAEFMPHLSAWPRPTGVVLLPLDVAELVDSVDTPQQAVNAVEASLAQIGSRPGRQLIVVSGLNILAWLFPAGLLQPIFKWLRSDNRVAVLVAAPSGPRRLPERAQLFNWRAVVKQSIAQGGADRIITLGGVQT